MFKILDKFDTFQSHIQGQKFYLKLWQRWLRGLRSTNVHSKLTFKVDDYE